MTILIVTKVSQIDDTQSITLRARKALWKVEYEMTFSAPPARTGTLRFLDRWQVRPLFSPPYTPEYNGACEAGNGALKNCTREEAARQGRIGYWTADDTEAARHMANEYHYPHGPLRSTHGQAFRERGFVSDQTRAAFGLAVECEQAQETVKQGYLLETDLGHAAQATIDRVAIGRVLVEHDFLTFTRRSIAPPIKSKNRLEIS